MLLPTYIPQDQLNIICGFQINISEINSKINPRAKAAYVKQDGTGRNGT